jgi:hypothetical protein
LSSRKNSLPPSLLRLSFLWESKLVAREEGRCAHKASAQLFRIADSWLLVAGFSLLVPSLPILYSFNQQQGTSNKDLIFNPHFAIGIPQFGGGRKREGPEFLLKAAERPVPGSRFSSAGHGLR